MVLCGEPHIEPLHKSGALLRFYLFVQPRISFAVGARRAMRSNDGKQAFKGTAGASPGRTLVALVGATPNPDADLT